MPHQRANLSAQPRSGRRPGTSGTRQAILEAARARFAADGYTAATIRRIAADAGVNASLVMQFFGSKDELFAAVVSISPYTLDRVAGAFQGPRDGLGERLARAYLQVWDGQTQDGAALMATLRGAITHQEAAAQLREFLQARLAHGMAAQGDVDHDALVRVDLASSMLIGVVLGRQILGLAALSGEDTEALVARIAPALQLVLDAPGPAPHAGHRDNEQTLA